MTLDEQLKTNALFRGVLRTSLKPYFKPNNFFQVKEGEIIYNTDSDASELYLVVEGEVKLKFCQDRHIEIKNVLDFFGEVEILNKCKRISFAVANTDCTLYKLNSSEIILLAQENEIVNRNLRKFGGNKDKENPDTNYNENKHIKNVRNTLDETETFEKLDLIQEDETKTLSDEELDSIIKKQKSRKEINNLLKKTTDIPDLNELGLED